MLDRRIGARSAAAGARRRAGGWAVGAAVVGTDADKKYWYAGPNGSGDIKQIGDATAVLSLSRSF